MQFAKRLSDLRNEAYQFIVKALKQQSPFALFTDSAKFANDWDLGVYEDFPEFLYFHRTEFACLAVIKEMAYINDKYIEIHGIGKGSAYPEEVTITLAELNDNEVILLADYLATLNTH